MRTARQIIKDSMEPLEPARTILRLFQENEGKRYDIRFIKKVEEAIGMDCRIERIAGKTKLAIRSEPYLDFVVAYQTTNVRISTETFKKINIWYLQAAEERNARRQSVLDTDQPEILDKRIKDFVEAREALKHILGSYDKFEDRSEILKENGILLQKFKGNFYAI